MISCAVVASADPPTARSYNKTARGRAWLKKNNWPANNAGFKAAIEDYIYRITDVVKKLGKKPIFWQEVSDKYVGKH